MRLRVFMLKFFGQIRVFGPWTNFGNTLVSHTAQWRKDWKNIKTNLLLFWLWGNHFGYCRQEKKYFPIWSTMNLEKISGKLEKMAFYVVILTMFQFSVFSSILLKSAYILKYLDIKGIIFHFNHSPELSQFLRNERPSVRFFDLWISISWSIWGQS